MCGIYGISKNSPLNEKELHQAKWAINELSHRGPDHSSYWLNESKNHLLGHTRLSIIDLDKRNNQPFSKYQKTIVYNGEIYNFKEIRSELETKGYIFETSGDTEVVISAWDCWGEECILKFDGMFAFAVYDNKNLFLVSDYFGEKPIYYTEQANEFIFSSEPKNIITNLSLSFDPSYEENLQFLAFGFIPPPNTGYKFLKSIEPATIIKINDGKILNKKKYWNIRKLKSNKEKKIIEKQDIEEIKSALIESIETRLISDVPIGMFLSSGVDSSLIASIISKELNKEINAYTVGISGADESNTASKIANHLGMKHEIFHSKENLAFKNIYQTISSVYGDVNDNTTALSIMQMCQMTKKNIKVAIGGVGGDELFYGYNKYKFLYKYRNIYRLNKSIISAISFLLNRILNNSFSYKFDNYFNNNNLLCFMALKNIEVLKLFKERSISLELGEFNNSEEDLFEIAYYFDINNTLPKSYLSAIDRGSMNQSLEVRSPYLNKKLFEIVSKFKPSAFLNKQNKIIQKSILSSYLPSELISSNKQGFITPNSNYSANINFISDRTPNYLLDFIKSSNKFSNLDNNRNTELRLNLLRHFYNY